MPDEGCLFVDTHVHLCDPRFDADRDAVLARAAAAGVGRLVEIADSPDDWPRALALARSRPATMRCALGLHPYYAERCTDELLGRLAGQAACAEVAAVGEIGLDYSRSTVAKETQQAALRRLLKACREWEKPVVLHCRDAYADLRAIVKERFPASPQGRRFWGVVHCFAGDADDARFFSEAGFALGADGPVTYPKNAALREAFASVGAAAVVLETDSPYLPPQSGRGRRNEPACVPEIAQALAGVWGLSPLEVGRITAANAGALFGWR